MMESICECKTKLKMLRFYLGLTRVDRFGDKAREIERVWMCDEGEMLVMLGDELLEKRKAKEEVYGYGKGRHAGG